MRKRNVNAEDLELEAFIELEGTVIDSRTDESTGTQHIAMVLDGTESVVTMAMPTHTKLKEVMIND